jgi:CRISPR/Cas system-associated exonuclease Cas4 (RecB family)
MKHSPLLIPNFSFSKSRYCTGLQCPKILWLDINRSEEKDASLINQHLLDSGTKAGELARGYFGPYSLVDYSEDKSVMLAETQRLIAARTPIICEAAFANDDGLCIVDILRQTDGGYNIIEVKSSTGLKDQHLDDMAFQYYILNACGLPIKNVSLMHINNQYERLGELDIQKLFALQDCTVEVLDRQKDISVNIKKIREIAGAGTEPDIPIGKHCKTPYPCPYQSYCSPDLADTLVDNNQPPIIDREKLNVFLETLSYPLYFLDFEIFQEAVPSYDHQRPYQLMSCQYSLHIQTEKGAEPAHREYLAPHGSDPRRALAERLCADIPRDVCVLAYWMSFEKKRIEELAALFPDLSTHLMAIHSNIKDLIVPFKTKAWHSHLQSGSNSLKAVVPAMFPDDPELNYQNLGLIQGGGEAMNAYAELPYKTPEEQQRIRDALLAYCHLDTLVMVKVLEKLQMVNGKW